MTFKDLVARLQQAERDAAALPHEAAEMTAPVLVESIREVIGHDPPLATLAESTQAERARLGYAPDEPLYRTGGYAASFQPRVVENAALAGTADERALWFESGNSRMPARPAMREGLKDTLPLAGRIAYGLVRRLFTK